MSASPVDRTRMASLGLDRSPRPRGRLRQTAGMLTPATATSLKIMSERDLDGRARRLVRALSDAMRQRARQTRPRMRSLMLSPGGRLRWRSVPAPPPPGPLGAVVHPIAMATCDLDRPLGLGRTPFPLPLHFGHECVAEVLSVGSEVENVRPGQRVVVPFQISCGQCAACAAGHTANCTTVPPISMYGFGLAGGHWGGAFADEMAVPFADGMLVPLPDGVAAAAAASVADNVSDAYRHVAPHLPRLLSAEPDAEVLVVGAVSRRSLFTPSVPLYTALIAESLGARNVVLVDARRAVRRNADALGIRALDPSHAARRRGSPLVADVSAAPRGLTFAISRTAPDGVCSSAGMLHAHCRIPVGLMYGRNVSLRVSRAHARTNIPHVLELMSSRRLRPERVTTLQAPLDDAPAVLAEHLAGNSVKTVLTA